MDAEAYGSEYVEADRRLRTQLGAGRVSARRGGRVRTTAFFSILLEIGMLRDRKGEVLAALFIQHPTGGQIGQG